MLGICYHCGTDLDSLNPMANIAPHRDGSCNPMNRLAAIFLRMNRETKSPFDELVQDALEDLYEELSRRATR